MVNLAVLVIKVKESAVVTVYNIYSKAYILFSLSETVQYKKITLHPNALVV